jgi:hypothetical protein
MKKTEIQQAILDCTGLQNFKIKSGFIGTGLYEAIARNVNLQRVVYTPIRGYIFFHTIEGFATLILFFKDVNDFLFKSNALRLLTNHPGDPRAKRKFRILSNVNDKIGGWAFDKGHNRADNSITLENQQDLDKYIETQKDYLANTIPNLVASYRSLYDYYLYLENLPFRQTTISIGNTSPHVQLYRVLIKALIGAPDMQEHFEFERNRILELMRNEFPKELNKREQLLDEYYSELCEVYEQALIQPNRPTKFFVGQYEITTTDLIVELEEQIVENEEIINSRNEKAIPETRLAGNFRLVTLLEEANAKDLKKIEDIKTKLRSLKA